MLSIDWTPSAGGEDESIDIDCSVTESYERAADVTDHPVEEGSDTADNVRPKNRTASFECLITNQPIFSPTYGMDGSSGSIQSSSVTVGGKTFTASTWQFSQPFDRVLAVDTAINGLIDQSQLVTITTGVTQIPNCAITRYLWGRTAENGSALSFTFEVSSLRIANSQTVAVSRPRRRAQQTQQNRGAVPPVVDNRAILARIADSPFAASVSHFLGGT